MRIEIEIPYLFECDYNKDKFNDFFSRVLSDIHNGVLCGRYEEEIAEMFIKAFAESRVAYDVEAVVAELEKKSKEYTKKAEEHEVYEDYCTRYYSIANGIDIAISIVRGKE